MKLFCSRLKQIRGVNNLRRTEVCCRIYFYGKLDAKSLGELQKSLQKIIWQGNKRKFHQGLQKP